MNFIEKFVFLIGWLRIVLSPLAIGVIVGFIVSKCFAGTSGIIIGVGCALIGLIIGILWAERVRKREGSMNFLGKVNASPELNNPEEKEEK